MTIIHTGKEHLGEATSLFSQIAVPKNPLLGAVYLSFSKGKLYFRNDSSFATVDLSVDLSSFEPKDIYIEDGSKFFTLAHYYPEIAFDGKSFLANDNSFTLSSRIEKFDPPEVNMADMEEVVFENKELFGKRLSSALKYVNSNLPSLSGVFVQDGTLIALQHQKSYVAKVGVSHNLTLNDSFAAAVSKTINNEGVRLLKEKEKHNYLIIGSNFQLFSKSNATLELPLLPDSEAFESEFNHSLYFEVDKDALAKAMSFIHPFVRDVDYYRLDMEFDTLNNKLILNVKDDRNSLRYNIDVVSFSEPESFVDISAAISLTSFKALVTDTPEENIRIFVDPDKTTIKVEPVDSKNAQFIVHSKLV